MRPLKIACMILGAVVCAYLFTLILPLLNQRDDAENAAGIFLILGLCAACVAVFPSAWRWMLRLVAVALFVPLLTGCTRIGPGHVGIKVSNAGDNRGVNQLPLSTGWVFYMPFGSTVFQYPTYVQTVVWSKDAAEGNPNEEITFNTSDNMVVGADVSLSYHLVDKDVPAFYVKFRSDDLKTFTDGFLHNTARIAFGRLSGNFTADEINSTKRAAYEHAVLALLSQMTAQYGLTIEQLGIIGKLHYPPEIQQAINAKVAAVQKAEQAVNELKVSQAEANKRVAVAEGEARANAALTSSITPTLLEWKRLEILQSKWDGKYPLYIGGGASPVPMIALPGSAQVIH
jgi:regulator of protease activity HflC (stomatin/prohibitin superfamily)